MNTNHLLLATLALFLAEILDDVQSSPTFTSIDTFDDVDMTLLHRAMRQGNDCDSQVNHLSNDLMINPSTISNIIHL